VEHRAFGKGLVLSCQSLGNDTLLEIAFDNVGTKRVMAAFANLKRC
jgi:DNA helicase-2/ATP-dependent DNA helicase PcrA